MAEAADVSLPLETLVLSIAPDERWDLPGGRMLLGESPTDSLRREVLEETALEVEVLGRAFVWHRYFEQRQFQLGGGRGQLPITSFPRCGTR